MAIELKVDAAIDPLQKYKLEKIATSGGIAIILTPDNFEKTFKFLEEIAKEAEGYYKQHGIIH